MTSFRFPLKRVLDWRRTQLELEEALYKQQAAELAAMDCARAEIEAAGIRAEVQVPQWSAVGGSDLAALDAFRRRVKSREAEIANRRIEFARKLAERQKTMLEARRRCRLLERLKERRKAEWEAALSRELDQIAAESFLAQWNRGQA